MLLGLVTPTALTQSYSFQHFRSDSEPGQMACNALAQDRDGYIWVATLSGLKRFNGVRFESFQVQDGLLDDHIRAIVLDQDGVVWFGSNMGLSRWEGNGFTNFKFGQERVRLRNMVSHPDGGIWIGTDVGLKLLKDGVIVDSELTQTAQLAINGLAYDDFQRLWLATENGLYYSQANKLFAYEEPSLNNKKTFGLALGADRRLRVTAETGVYVIDDLKLTTHYSAEALGGIPSGGILVDHFNIVWVAMGNEVALIDKHKISRLNQASGLPIHRPHAFLEDRDGMIWIAGIPGLAAFSGRAFTNYTVADGLASNPVTAVLQDRRGWLWVGTIGGLSRREDNATFQEIQGINNPHVTCLYEGNDGHIWIGTLRGLNRFDEKGYHEVISSDKAWVVRQVVEQRDKTLWIYVNEKGLLRGTESGEFQNVQVPGQRLSRPVLILDQQDQLWISGEKGLSCWNGQVWKTFTTEQGLDYDRIYPIAEDQEGAIWVGYHSRKGVTMMKEGRAVTYNSQHGLPDSKSYLLGVDQRGDVWVGTARGLGRINENGITSFCRLDGLAGEEFNQGAYEADVDGSSWFGTMEGLSHYNPRFDLTEGVLPKVRIEQVQLEQVSITDGESVPYNHDDLEVQVEILTHVAREHLSVRERLVGSDSGYRTVVDGRINYTHLPPAEYRLEVQARLFAREWSRPVTYHFKIVPPTWKKVWFLILLALAILMLVFGLVRWRVHRVETKRRNLEELVNHRTRELQAEISEKEITRKELLAARDELLTQAHQAGRAEIATGVLHNIGNILSSVTTSAGVIRENLEKSKLAGLGAANQLLLENADNLQHFFTETDRGRKLIPYYQQLELQLAKEQDSSMDNICRLLDKIDAIRNYIMMHQAYARIGFFEEQVQLAEVVEDALALQAGSIERHAIRVKKEYGEVPGIRVQKAKLINILINLYKNAKEAMEELDPEDRLITISINGGEAGIELCMGDNGCGIDPALRDKLFTQGFTTKISGHGFGLHSCANYMQEMGGRIEAKSDGAGTGSVFILWFPLRKT